MIIYHPGYDVNHCSYRILNILYSVKKNELNYETLKIVDFYYVYPHLLKRISNLPRPLNYHAKKIESVSDSFELTPNQKSLFFDMSSSQEAAISSLLQKSLVNINDGIISLNNVNLPSDLVNFFECDEFRKSDFFSVLINCFPKVTLEGVNGFKSRSGLMEYRYD